MHMIKWGVQLAAREPPRAPGYNTLDQLMHVFFGLELFSCAIPHFAVWSWDRSRTPVIHLLLLLFPKKIWLNFESSQQILTNFQPVRFLLHRQVFRH